MMGVVKVSAQKRGATVLKFFKLIFFKVRERGSREEMETVFSRRRTRATVPRMCLKL